MYAFLFGNTDNREFKNEVAGAKIRRNGLLEILFLNATEFNSVKGKASVYNMSYVEAHMNSLLLYLILC